MQQLTYLRLAHVGLDWPDGQASSSRPGGAVLALSTRLCTLEIATCGLGRAPGRQLFNPTRPLYYLTSLQLHCMQPYLAVSDLKCIVRSCPPLRELDLTASTPNDMSLLPLRQLTRLTSLAVNGISNDSAVRVLAQLTGLQQLVVCLCTKDQLVSRLLLTALRQLTGLKVSDNDSSSPQDFQQQVRVHLVGTR